MLQGPRHQVTTTGPGEKRKKERKKKEKKKRMPNEDWFESCLSGPRKKRKKKHLNDARDVETTTEPAPSIIHECSGKECNKRKAYDLFAWVLAQTIAEMMWDG